MRSLPGPVKAEGKASLPNRLAAAPRCGQIIGKHRSSLFCELALQYALQQMCRRPQQAKPGSGGNRIGGHRPALGELVKGKRVALVDAFVQASAG